MSDDPDQLLRLRADGSTRTVVLQDHLQWLPDGRFLPGARRDATVEVGGVNVDLQQLHWTFGPALPVNAQGKACDWPVDSGP